MPRLLEGSQNVPHKEEADKAAANAEQLERRRQVRGLLLLALAAIVFAILRAGVHRVFTTGWWRLW
jgi:hypothetical protein